jgi:hypothetical protein
LTKVTKNYFGVKDLSLLSPERDLSIILSLFSGNFRLVMIVQGLVFRLLVGIGREGHWEMESKRPNSIKEISIGKIIGQDRHLCWILEIFE